MLHPRWLPGIAGCLVILASGGCAPKPKPVVASPITDIWEAPKPPAPAPAELERTPTAATEPAPGLEPLPSPPDQIIAVVNGTPITRSSLVEQLIESHGLGLLEQMILLTAARQRAAQLGLKITEADTAAMHDEALTRLATPVIEPDSKALDSRQAQRLLDEFLQAKNISRTEWEIRLEQRAYLRKIAEAEVARMDISEEMLKNEYEQDYGEKVQIRHIQVGSLATAARVRALLAAGKDFELVARQMSANPVTAAQGGLTRPFTRKDPGVTPLLRQAAFNLKVGEVSEAILDGNVYQIIRLERRFPASDVGFANIDRNELRRKLVRRLVQQREQDLEGELFQSAVVNIRNDELARQFREKHRKVTP
jgi:parvulin-like peptidyl-prolyl isomerase